MKSYKKGIKDYFLILTFLIMVPNVIAETLYLDAKNGNDTNIGTKGKPLKTLAKAAEIVNSSERVGPTTIKLEPGVYNITECVTFKNTRGYTEKDRLTIEAAILPDDPNWTPALMPVILSTEDPRKPEKNNELTETYSIKIKINHVTIRGLKFLGNPLSNNWHCCIERVGDNLKDLVITQCMFIGDKDTLDIYCAALATGDGFVVDHCIFQKCHACTVFWDGQNSVPGKKNAMRYSIVKDAYISGVWTCQTAEDFEFHHNIVTDSDYFWMRKPDDKMKYQLFDCIVTGNKFYSGYGIATGPTGLTGDEVVYDEANIIKNGKVVFVKDKKAKDYLHVAPGTFGSKLGAGLFKKRKGANIP